MVFSIYSSMKQTVRSAITLVLELWIYSRVDDI